MSHLQLQWLPAGSDPPAETYGDPPWHKPQAKRQLKRVERLHLTLQVGATSPNHLTPKPKE